MFGSYSLEIQIDASEGGFCFRWLAGDGSGETLVSDLILKPADVSGPKYFLSGVYREAKGNQVEGCSVARTSIRALVKRVSDRFPLAKPPRLALVRREEGVDPVAPEIIGLAWNNPLGWRLALEDIIVSFVNHFLILPERESTVHRAGTALREIFPNLFEALEAGYGADVVVNQVDGYIGIEWRRSDLTPVCATGRVECTGLDELTWTFTPLSPAMPEVALSPIGKRAVRSQLERWINRYPVSNSRVTTSEVALGPTGRPERRDGAPFGLEESPWDWLVGIIMAMGTVVRTKFTPMGRLDALVSTDYARLVRRDQRKMERLQEEEARRRETMERLAAERRERERVKRVSSAQMSSAKDALAPVAAPAPTAETNPLPPITLRVELPVLNWREADRPLTDLQAWRLKEEAARWWVSNQSDDLLCLPYCRIQRLDYQVRSALRVLGPLRGRALLSDEVGLGKTIEAGLVLKEWLTRGMVRRFLVLTVPSLVEQWAEELSDKFGIATATTLQADARADAHQFWNGNPGIVASLHTVKQPAQLEIVRAVNWDLIIVDEAHYLRNRDSQAWQAVNALPRQFLLLLTATPVQNSLEELYNLVTLLQPGQLPPPKEFRARFLDPKKPRQPKEPEELRRLLGQVMIRNTRANAGVNLPPRRAETVLFDPDPEERTFWSGWETELREELSRLSGSQSSLWGRLLLQTAGSSPAAWRGALRRFPNAALAQAWRERSPLEGSWKRKCELLPPLTRGEGGLVIFTQFLETQAALVESLVAARVPTFFINGSTPAADRHDIAEQFRKAGGALLLTHSGTEGRNLQFCHRLVNFDLPWNPMEIEQRIGRLHRLGQQHPVRIYNLVQAGTLQEQLLEILQEKLNLFELVVGETGLVLGERLSGEEFAEEVLRRWRLPQDQVAEAFRELGEELAAARDGYRQVQELDQTLFAQDYETL